MVNEPNDDRQTVRLGGNLEVAVDDLIELSSDWYWMMDADLRYTFFSPRVQEVTGTPPEWHYGKTRQELGITVRDGDDPIERHQPFTGLIISRRHKEGGRLWMRSSGTPIFDDDGTFMGYIGTGSDVTAEITAQQEIARQHRLFLDSMESMADGVAVFDDQDKLVFCNSSFKSMNPDLAPDIVVGMTFEDMVRINLDHGRILDAIGREDDYLQTRMAQFREPDAQPIVSRRKDGRTLLLIERRLDDGSTFLINRDLTEIKTREAELETARNTAEAANRAKSAFLASMSHELRTPLNAIIGFSDLLRLNPFGPTAEQKNAEYIADIHASAVHLLNLINDVLDLSTIEAGKLEANRQATDVGPVLTESLEMTKLIANDRGVDIRLAIDSALPEITADPRHLTQIFINLISNAVKYTPPDGEVRISAAEEKAGVCISVSDTGDGIAPTDIPRMLESFERADDVMTRKQPGTGLGLPLAKGLTELNGGAFSIESAVGEGTVVTVRFPA